MSGIDLSRIPVVILAGGRGARFDHESQVMPKPLIDVAGKPIIEHVLDSLASQGFREFIIPVGYLGDQVRQWAATRWGREFFGTKPPLIRSILVEDTGDDSHTGLRLWKVRHLINGRRFVLTYGDGLSNVDMGAVIEQHELTGAGVTITAVRPPGRFGVIEFAYPLIDDLPQCPDQTLVGSFSEKSDVGWINGGFMVMEPEFITQYIEGEFELESTALVELAACGGLHAYRHNGYWRCMDTRRDREQIEEDVRVAGRLPWMR